MALLNEIPPSMIDVWKGRVQSSVRVKRPEDVERIAELCALAEWSGDRYANVWHEAAGFYGSSCHCRRCAS